MSLPAPPVGTPHFLLLLKHLGSVLLDQALGERGGEASTRDDGQ